MKKKKLKNKLTKICIRCNSERPIEEFYRYERLCKICKRKYSREKNWKLRDGINVEEAAILWDSVKHCQVCGSSKNLHLDHDHESLDIRGILCSQCNMALGLLRDSAELCKKAGEYLEKT